MINKQELREILNDLLKIAEEVRAENTDNFFVQPKIDFNILFQEACSYHRGILMGRNKNEIKQDNSPTEKQKQFLEKNRRKLIELGIDVDRIKTKGQAFEAISNFKKVHK